ncbi:hypothetical protein HaLaN_30907, partial [Haematococcus lacustris]
MKSCKFSLFFWKATMKCMASSTTHVLTSVHLVHVRSMKVTPSNRAFSTPEPLLPNLNLVKLVRTSVESCLFNRCGAM